jgi:hypothetical protein
LLPGIARELHGKSFLFGEVDGKQIPLSREVL